MYDLIVIGAGPAGLLSAWRGASQGLKTLLLEKKSQAGSKLLTTGSGQCNITHAGSIDELLSCYGDAQRFIRNSLYHFSNDSLIELLESNGLALEDRGDGKVFPISRKSRDVLNSFTRMCRDSGVTIYTKQDVQEIQKKGPSFKIFTASSETFEASSLIIATGGKSYPSTGSTGDGYRFAQNLGHSIIEPRPALTPLYIKNSPFTICSGISLSASLILQPQKGKRSSFEGDLLLTHKGLSGPLIINNSRFFHEGDKLLINWLAKDASSIEETLLEGSQKEGQIKLGKFLSRYNLAAKLLQVLIQLSGLSTDLLLSQLGKQKRRALIKTLCEYEISVQTKGDFNVAMVTAGGVNLKEVNPKTMESRIAENLYFAGECLDVDGDTGGYNLQFAFSSGVLAADSIIKKRG